MFEQLTQLVQQYGGDAVVNNSAVPNEHNEAVLNETSNSIFAGLQKIVSEGGTEQIAGLFNGNSPIDSSNPVVQQISATIERKPGREIWIEQCRFKWRCF